MSAQRPLTAYIEGLVLGQGRYAGQLFELHGWQRRFLKGAFGQPGDAALTVARGSGKTTFAAAVASATVNGPLVEPMAECLVVASSFDQALIAFRHILHFLRPALDKEPGRWRVQDSANRATVTDRKTGAMIRVLGSDPGRLHGAAPKLLLYDEVAQWPSTKVDRMLAALRTSRGKIPGSKALWLGTRAASPDHPFEIQLQTGSGYKQIHAARKNDSPFQRRTWLRANPALDQLPDLEAVIRDEAEAARREPSLMASFKALRLNQGVSDVARASLLDAGLWESIEGDADASGPICWGVDLGTSAAMSAVSCYWPDTGRLDVVSAFPSEPGLAERGLRDGVGSLYSRMAHRGELIECGPRVVDVAILLREAMSRFGPPDAVAADRWREAELKDALDSAGVPAGVYVERGQGFKDGAQDVCDFRKGLPGRCCHADTVPYVEGRHGRSRHGLGPSRQPEAK